MPLKLLPIEEVAARTCLSKPTICLKLRDDEFPKPVQLGNRVRGWLEHESDAWIQEKAAARDALPSFGPGSRGGRTRHRGAAAE